MKIEIIATSTLRKILAKTRYLEPYINENDREPSWDGYISVYSAEKQPHAKEDLKGRVHIQVKGSTNEKLLKEPHSFPVEISDLRNYLREGGAIFFVVFIDKNDKISERVYYKSLLPFDLKKLLGECHRKQNKVIHLKEFPNCLSDIEEIFFNFIADREKQLVYIECKDISDFLPFNSFSLGYTAVGRTDEHPFNYMFRHDFFIYGDIMSNLKIPISHIEKVEKIIETHLTPVTVGGIEFYKSFKEVFYNNYKELHFGDHITITISPENNSCSYCLEGALSSVIHSMEFLYMALKIGKIEINNVSFPFIQTESKVLNDLEKYLSDLKTLKETLDIAGVQEELDYKNLSEKDIWTIRSLVTSLHDRCPVSLDIESSRFISMKIGNLKILLCACRHENTTKYDIISYYDTRITLKMGDGNGTGFPHYILLSHEDLLNYSNIDFERILDKIENTHFNPEFSGQMTDFLLEILHAYDVSFREKFLFAAKRIALLLKEKEKYSKILDINYYQVVKRERPLNITEKEYLHQLVKNEKNREMLTGIYLLLDNYDDAKRIFLEMNKDTQERFRMYPIYRFFDNSSLELKN